MIARSSLRIAIGAAFATLVLIASLVDLDRVPAPWWDEGWTMNVARNWVEHGWYGQMLIGKPASPGLAAAFPTVASVALSFKLFGVGVWQARLAVVVYALLSLVLLYWLGSRLYDRTVALTALVLLVLLAPYPFLSPVFVGRQVLAEMPMLFFLLGGYVAFWLALRRSPWWLFVAIIAWGIGLISKAQPLPFWGASLLVPFTIMLIRRHRRLAILLAAAFIGSLISMRLAGQVQNIVLHNSTLSSGSIPGLYEVTAWVINSSARQQAALRVLLMGMPTLFGLLYGAIQAWRSVRSGVEHAEQNILRLMLLSFSGTWFIWYVCLSVGLERYLFPAVFVGSLFTAAALAAATDHFSLSSTVHRLRDEARQRRPGRSTLWLGVFVVVLLMTLPQIGLTLASSILPAPGPALAEVAAYLNARTKASDVIESYDSEVFVELERLYHFPPEALNTAAIRRTLLNQDIAYDYDPLAADPDYLVVGPFIRAWHIYDAVIASGQFKQVYHNDRYEVYARVR